jgi:molybdenum cofactor cytidylyltransferase
MKGALVGLLLAAVDPVLAVVRPGSDELARRLRSEGARVAICAEAEQGLGVSLSFGVRNTPEAGGWLIALADMPWIRPATVRAVAAAMQEGARLAAASYRGRRGHPVGFAATYRSDLIALRGDMGARPIITANLASLRRVECDDPGIVMDIDEAADLSTCNGPGFGPPQRLPIDR